MKMTLNELREMVRSIIVENEDSTSPNIHITQNVPDERAPMRESEPTYSVDYDIELDGQLLQFSGTLKPFHTGRATEYEFEPSWFQDEESSEYYDSNWEKIEEEILSKLHSL